MDEPNKYNEYMKTYYHNNKQRINEKKHCEICNCNINKRAFPRHLLSTKHQKNSE